MICMNQITININSIFNAHSNDFPLNAKNETSRVLF